MRTLLAAVTLVFLLAACAQVPPAPIPVVPTPTEVPTVAPTATLTLAPTPSPSATPSPTATPKPTATRAPIRLELWHGQGQQQHAALLLLADEFNRTHSGVQVTVVNKSSASELASQVRAGPRPDIVLAYSYDIAGWIKSNLVVPLDPLMQDAGIGFSAEDLKDILPAFVDRYPLYRNRVYSLSFARALEVMYFNLDLIKAAGFTKPPETWDDFAKLCAAVSKPPDVLCYEMSADASDFASWVMSRGGDLTSSDGRSATFDRLPGLDALYGMADLFRKKQAGVATRAFQEPTDFAAARVAITFDSTMGLTFYDKAVRDSGKVTEWGIAPMPHTTQSPVVDAYGPSAAILASTGERERAAFTFIKWMMDPGPNDEWAEATGYLPARSSTKERMTGYVRLLPVYGQELALVPYARTEPNLAAWAQVRTVIADMLAQVASGKVKPEDALYDAGKKANDILASQ